MRILLLSIMLTCIIVLSSCEESAQVNEPHETTILNNGNTYVDNQYIVVFDQSKPGTQIFASGSFDLESYVKEFLKSYNIDPSGIRNIYSHAIKGFCANMTADEAAKINNDSRVGIVEQDFVVKLVEPDNATDDGEDYDDDGEYDEEDEEWNSDNDETDGWEDTFMNANGGVGTLASQQTPWGIKKIGGFANYTGDNVAWVIDTGIDLDHPDLNVATSQCTTFVTSGNDATTADDFHGHGTHVAGTIAAIDNSIGVVGVAAGADVIGVKVLNSSGSGYLSWVINGIDHVYDNAGDGDVVNMSFGGSASSSLDAAVRAFHKSGVYVSIAAGNSSDNAGNYSPARVNGKIIRTISACDKKKRFASFSNYGNPPIDYCAPGVNIISTYKGGLYATMSGTSMAAPHVAGIMLVNNGKIKKRGLVKNDPDGNSDRFARR